MHRIQIDNPNAWCVRFSVSILDQPGRAAQDQVSHPPDWLSLHLTRICGPRWGVGGREQSVWKERAWRDGAFAEDMRRVLICIQRKLHLPMYPPNTCCICGYHVHNGVFGNYAFCCDKDSKKCTHNTTNSDFPIILSPELVQAGYIYPNSKLDIKTHLHLRSDPTAQDRSTYPSTRTPPPTTTAPTTSSAQMSPLQEPHHPQNVTHLKTSSKPSLPMQITIFKWMNDANFLTRRHSCSLTINVTPVSYFLYLQ